MNSEASFGFWLPHWYGGQRFLDECTVPSGSDLRSITVSDNSPEFSEIIFLNFLLLVGIFSLKNGLTH